MENVQNQATKFDRNRDPNGGKKPAHTMKKADTAKGTNIPSPDAKVIATIMADQIKDKIAEGAALLESQQTIGSNEVGKVEEVVGQTAQAPATQTAAIPALVVKRASRIAGLQERVVGLLKTSAATVTEMAVKFEVPERDVRLAIDRARAKGENIKRLSKNTFGYQPIAPKA